MIKTIVAEQILSYEPVAHVLEQRLDIIQKQWHCKVINVIETKGYACPGCSDQAFIILYDDGEDPGATKGEDPGATKGEE